MRRGYSILAAAAATTGFLGLAFAMAPSVAAAPAKTVVFSAGFMAIAASANPADNLPDGPGKDKIIGACGGCHQPDIVIGQKRDAEGWRELVDQMVARGANVEEGDYELIIAYLARGNAATALGKTGDRPT